MKNIEILLATYNGESYLDEQLQSILAQDTQAWHLTVSDDASTDKTSDILDEYVQNYPDKITRVYSGRRFGCARDHFFWLMSQCNAQYMQFSDQDDVWHPDKVRLLQEALEKAEREHGTQVPMLVFSDQTVVDQELQPIAPSLMQMQQQNPKATDYRNILFQNIVTGCTMGINRVLADLAGKCPNPAQTIMHDWWLALVAAKFGQLIYVPQSTIEYRQHRKNSVGAKDTRSFSYFVYKILHLKAFQKTVLEKKSQAAAFLAVYADALSAEEQAVLREFSCAHSSSRFKLHYFPWISTPARKIGFLLRW